MFSRSDEPRINDPALYEVCIIKQHIFKIFYTCTFLSRKKSLEKYLIFVKIESPENTIFIRVYEIEKNFAENKTLGDIFV